MALHQHQPAAAPIGASMLHFMGESHSHDATTSTATTATMPTLRPQQLVMATAAAAAAAAPCIPAIPCLLLGPSSSNSRRRNNILVQGPSKSGKTSMAMNVAYACASTAVCSCARNTSNNTSTTCQCVAVIMFRPAVAVAAAAEHSKDNENSNLFPLPCIKVRVVEHENEQKYYHENDPPNGKKVPLDFATRYKNLDQRPTQAQQGPNNNNNYNNNNSTIMGGEEQDWNAHILQRIQIHVVSSIREVLHELLSLLGKPLSQQPSRAIIIDDLDIMAGARTTTTASINNVNNDDSKNSMISMMQTLAIAVDTSHALQRLHGMTPVVLATTTSSSSSSTLKTNKIVAPWMDSLVSLTSSSAPVLHQQPQQQQHSSRTTRSSIMACLPAGSLVVNCWKAQIEAEGKEVEQQHQECCVEYVVAKRPNGSLQLYWQECEECGSNSCSDEPSSTAALSSPSRKRKSPHY